MFNGIKLILFFSVVLGSITNAKAQEELKEKVKAASEKVNCISPVQESAIEENLFGQKSKSLVFLCKEFDATKTKKREAPAVVINSLENKCAEWISSKFTVGLRLRTAADALGSRTHYGDLDAWGTGVFAKSKKPKNYKSPKAKELVAGSVITACLTIDCDATYNYVCDGSEWLFVGRD